MYRKTYSLNVDIARFYNVYGPSEIVDGPWAAVIGIWRRQVRDGESLLDLGFGCFGVDHFTGAGFDRVFREGDEALVGFAGGNCHVGCFFLFDYRIL